MALVYTHIKPCGEVFYVGIGSSKNRAYSPNGRNRFWKKIKEKYGYEVKIIKDNISWEEAQELEIFIIDFYGRRDLGLGTLCNLTDGGEGQLNPSKEVRNKMSLAKKGVEGINKHFLGVPKTEKHKEKLRKAKLGKKLTDDHKKALTEANKAKELIGRKVICIDTLKVWMSTLDCEKEIGIRNLRDYLNPNRINLKNKTSIQYLDDYEKGIITCKQKIRKRNIKIN